MNPNEQVINFETFDPFTTDSIETAHSLTSNPPSSSSTSSTSSASTLKGDGKVHIRLQKRNARKSICTVEGLSENINFKRVLKHLKKKLCCNGCIVEDKTAGKVLQLQGDQRAAVAKFLIEEQLVSRNNLQIHGY